MKKIAVVGVYGTGPDFTTGQAVKCHTLIDWLKTKYGEKNVKIVSTHRWKRKPIKLLFSLFVSVIRCTNIVIMPAQNGIRIFGPVVYRLNRLFHRSLHYIVIGGWLAEMLQEKPKLKKCLQRYDGIYVEMISMQKKLNDIGLNNVYYMPNCRDVKIVDKLATNYNLPINICTYSRVVKEKGILDAIEITRKANVSLGGNVFHLDVYGKVASEFQTEFDEALKCNEDIAAYKGCKNADETIQTLSNYFALLFPTYYEGEGFAGTILDGFVAQVPVIANDWKYNSEIIESGVNGMVYPYRDVEKAAEMLVELYKNKDLYRHLQENCKKSAIRYSTDTVMQEFVGLLK